MHRFNSDENSKMKNNSNLTSQENQNQTETDYIFLALTYLPLVIIAFGVVCNTLAFLIFRLDKQFNKKSSMVYFSFITITDTFSLFVWNLDHFTGDNLKIWIEWINRPICHITSFGQYFTLESSAILLSMATIDRYITVISVPGSFASKLPFRTPRSAFYWSIGILAVIALINLHILIFPRKSIKDFNGFACYIYDNGFYLFPVWENVHLAIFSVIPFIVMTIFNGLLIKNILVSNKSIKSQSNVKSISKKKRATFSLVLVTVFFLIMTLPASIFFGYFFDHFYNLTFGPSLLIIMDSLSFMNSSSIFFITLATNSKFRQVLSKYFQMGKYAVITQYLSRLSEKEQQNY